MDLRAEECLSQSRSEKCFKRLGFVFNVILPTGIMPRGETVIVYYWRGG